MLSLDLFTQHSVRCGEGVVMLDFETDSYFCRYDPEPAATADPSGEPRAPVWRDPPDGDAWLTPRDIRQFVGAYLDALTTFLRKPIRTLMIEIAHLERVAQADAPEVHIVAARFERMSLYLPFRPSCLLGTYALGHYLARHGHAADWIIGVQLFPFRAHCWLAAGDMLLNERAHLVEDYAPIYRFRRSAA